MMTSTSQQGKYKVCVVIPCRFINQRLLEITEKYVWSIIKNTIYRPYEILIYDNNSVQFLSNSFRSFVEEENLINVRIINLGRIKFNIHKVYNRSLSDSDADIFIFSNNDMEVLNKGWMSNIVRWLTKPAPIYDYTMTYFVKKEGNVGVIIPDTKSGVEKKPPIRVLTKQAPASPIYAMRRDTIERLGGFDERFDLFFEDFDVFWSAEKAGYDVCIAHDVLLKHPHERTTIELTHGEFDFHNAYRRFGEKWKIPPVWKWTPPPWKPTCKLPRSVLAKGAPFPKPPKPSAFEVAVPILLGLAYLSVSLYVFIKARRRR